MPKFILIDHSILEFGGHYFEYALHVLKAAKKAGFETHLAVNRGFRIDKSSLDFKVHPKYKYDFWGDLKKKKPKSSGLLKRLRLMVSSAKFKLKLGFKYSWVGLLWEEKKKSNLLTVLQNVSIIHAIIFALVFAPLYYVYRVLKSLARFIYEIVKPLKKYTLGVLKALAGFIKAIFSPLIFPVKNKRPLYNFIKKHNRIGAFEKSTNKLFKEIRIEEGDIVFIPTLSEIDMSGLFKYIKKHHNSQKATWHLVFRRNIFEGREPDYTRQLPGLREFRNVFQIFSISKFVKNVFFYTDTEKLSNQYNMLNTVYFDTLPIPVNTKLHEDIHNEKSGSLRIVYLGDARREKGYQFIPEIVDQLWDKYISNNKVVFDLQSNFTFTSLENNADIVFARDKLDELPCDKIVLHKNPLNSDEYLKLVKSGDIALLFYDRNNYYARSSGALVECLTAGIPVIVPSGSWLAEQYVHKIYEHHQSEKNKLQLVKSFKLNDLSFENSGQKGQSPVYDNKLAFGGEKTNSFCVIDKPYFANYLFITFNIHKFVQEGSYIRTKVCQYDSNKNIIDIFSSDDGKVTSDDIKNSVMIPINKNTKKILISFANSFGNNTLYLDDLLVDFMSNPTDEARPLGSVGLIYTDPEQIPMLLSDIIDNYEHYHCTALSFSDSWVNKHNVERLVNMLKSKTLSGKG